MAGESFETMFDTLVRDVVGGQGDISQPDVRNPPKTDTSAAAIAAAQAAPAPAAPAATPPAQPEAAQAQPEGQDEGTEIEGLDAPEGEGGDQQAAQQQDDAGKQPAAAADDDALARLADLLTQRQQQPQPQQQTQPQPQPQPQMPPIYTPDEVQFLTQYQQDYPDVVRAEALMRRQEYRALTAHIFNQVSAYLAPQLALLNQLADTTAYTQLAQQVPDFDQQRDNLVAWVATQPDYLQVGMNHVIQSGTVEQITDLFNRFRQATGATSPTPSTSGVAPGGGQGGRATPAPANAPELSPAARQAAGRLAPVSGKRSAPTQAAPATFEDAFEQFAKA